MTKTTIVKPADDQLALLFCLSVCLPVCLCLSGYFIGRLTCVNGANEKTASTGRPSHNDSNGNITNVNSGPTQWLYKKETKEPSPSKNKSNKSARYLN